MQIVEIRRNADRLVRVYNDDCEWGGDYIWSDGNYGCDCNRELFFARAAGEEQPWDSVECGDGAYSIRIKSRDGALLYQDGDWEQ